MTTPSAEDLHLQPTRPAGSANKALANVVAVLENWHNDTHPGAAATCQDQPCLAVRAAIQPLSRSHRSSADLLAGL